MAVEHDSGRRQGLPAPLDQRIATVAVQQYGVVSIAQLRALGLSPRGVQHRARRGALHRVHRGVYAVGYPTLTLDGRRMAAVLAAGPRAVLSHRSAAALWDLVPSSKLVQDVTIAGRGRRRITKLAIHETRSLPACERDRHRGLPVTSVARTLVDLSAVLTPAQLARALHQAEVLQRLDMRELLPAMARARGRAGLGKLRAAIAAPAPGLVRSTLEARFAALCRAQLPTPRLNAPVRAGGEWLEVDVLWAREQLVVELDGAAFHATRRAFHEDRRRDALLAAHGYLVMRYTWDRVRDEPDAVISEVRRALVRRVPPGTSG